MWPWEVFSMRLAPFTVLFASLVAMMSVSAVSQGEDQRPNILLILADDLGYSDLGCYGSEIQTPTLDALAESGVRFSECYNTGRCWPTRASLLTGYYPQQVRRDFLPGIPTGGGNRGKRPAWAKLLPQRLGDAGYRCYHSGKWHLDGDPKQQGFDESWTVQAGRYFQPKPGKDGKQGRPLEFRDDWYLTSALADDAIENLQNHFQQHAEQPFFQYLAYTAPHFPLQALQADIDRYQAVYQQGWDQLRNQRLAKMKQLGLLNKDQHFPALSQVEPGLGAPYFFADAYQILGPGEMRFAKPWSALSETQKQFQAEKMAIHAAMIDRMDRSIGRVIELLKKRDQLDNTLVVFLSDNGASAELMVRGDGHDPKVPMGSAFSYLCLGPGWSTVCNSPFRRHKTWTHEGGISTPMIVSWPKSIKARRELLAGPQHVIDVPVTLLELAGVTADPDAPPTPGQSFAKRILEQNEPTASDRTLWWYHDGHRAIRKGDWKAVAPYDEPWELYHVAEDRAETRDLALSEFDRLKVLRELWQDETDAMIELASADLNAAEKASGAKQTAHRSGKMWEAQLAANTKRKSVLINGETFFVEGRKAFLMKPDQPAQGNPWVFYAPTLPGIPDRHESWMHQQFLDAGIAVAGIDLGEAYGSPHSSKYFDAFYQHLQDKGYHKRCVLLGRSRGGLWISRFAIDHPERVQAIAGIYPVFDYRSYPGVARAGLAYRGLDFEAAQFTPVLTFQPVIDASIPVFLIHGDVDKVVPLEANSQAIQKAYQAAGKGDLIEIEVPKGQGHNVWPGFFRSQKLVDFVIEHAE